MFGRDASIERIEARLHWHRAFLWRVAVGRERLGGPVSDAQLLHGMTRNRRFLDRIRQEYGG